MIASPVIAGRELAQRLERDEALSQEECAAAVKAIDPARDVATMALGGGRAVWCGRDSFFSEACGVAMDGPVGDDDLAALEEFYRSRDGRARVKLNPFADSSLWKLVDRGFQITEWHNVFVRSFAEEIATPPLPARCSIVRADPDDLRTWAEVCARGFVNDPAKAAEQEADLFALTRMTESRFYLARIGDQVAGVAAWGDREGLAVLYATTVLAEFRGAGVHAALIAQRLRDARAAGCDLASAVALPGSGSQRNFERAGFHVAYTKLVLSAALPS